MQPLPHSDELDHLRQILRLLRAYIARLNNPALQDIDALLSVAEAELARAINPDRK